VVVDLRPIGRLNQLIAQVPDLGKDVPAQERQQQKAHKSAFANDTYINLVRKWIVGKINDLGALLLWKCPQGLDHTSSGLG
jgi:hypothetical protein